MRDTEAFFDTRPAFSKYLREQGVPEACRMTKVRQRKVPRILPAVSELNFSYSLALWILKSRLALICPCRGLEWD